MTYIDPNPGTQPPVIAEPPRKRRPVRVWLLIAGSAFVGGIAVIVAIGVAVSGNSIRPAKAPASPAASQSADPGQQCVASGGMWNGSACLTETPAPSPADTLTGPAGTTFTVTADDGTSYDVTLNKVTQHVRLGQYDTLNNYADHAAAAEFTITGDTGSSSDDAYSDANAIGSDQTEYQSSFITDNLPGFSSGEFQVAPGQTVKGWVTFELPPGVTIAQVQWAPSFNGPAATWTIGS
jgi:hypothetical protein